MWEWLPPNDLCERWGEALWCSKICTSFKNSSFLKTLARIASGLFCNYLRKRKNGKTDVGRIYQTDIRTPSNIIPAIPWSFRAGKGYPDSITELLRAADLVDVHTVVDISWETRHNLLDYLTHLRLGKRPLVAAHPRTPSTVSRCAGNNSMSGEGGAYKHNSMDEYGSAWHAVCHHIGDDELDEEYGTAPQALHRGISLIFEKGAVDALEGRMSPAPCVYLELARPLEILAMSALAFNMYHKLNITGGVPGYRIIRTQNHGEEEEEEDVFYCRGPNQEQAVVYGSIVVTTRVVLISRKPESDREKAREFLIQCEDVENILRHPLDELP
ncbi:hypothetical protein C8R43DRAFT_952530 [Mycena crocata]|nr:hypothetical protein C8R43DRAFT_952530 [Mycena crocata]